MKQRIVEWLWEAALDKGSDWSRWSGNIWCCNVEQEFPQHSTGGELEPAKGNKERIWRRRRRV